MYLLNPYRVHHWRTSELYEALKAYLGSFIQSVEKGGVCRTPDQAMNRGQKLSAREINSNLNRYQNKKKKKGGIKVHVYSNTWYWNFEV